MNWNKLKDNQCPKCNKPLFWNDGATLIYCGNCDFKISAEKYKTIVRKTLKPSAPYKPWRPEDENPE